MKMDGTSYSNSDLVKFVILFSLRLLGYKTVKINSVLITVQTGTGSSAVIFIG